MRRSGDAHKWIGGAYARCERLAVGICLKAITQEVGIALVDLLKAGHRSSSIGEGLGRDAPGDSNVQYGGHVVKSLVLWKQRTRGKLGEGAIYTIGMEAPTF